MLRLLPKYKLQIERIFLFVYLGFIALSIFHVHRYDLNQLYNFSAGSENYPATDLTGDFNNFCLLHEFLQTLDNYHYSSDKVIAPLMEITSSDVPNNEFVYNDLYPSDKAPRAPPVNL